MIRIMLVSLMVSLVNLAMCAERPPNIIFILEDDMGYGDSSVYNPKSRIQTPHIDQLAEEGMLLTDAHSAASTCTPSRYGLLTGVNPARTGVLNTLLTRGDPIIAEQNDVSQSNPAMVERLFTDFKEFANSRELK